MANASIIEIKWEIDAEGTLTVTGAGRMPDFGSKAGEDAYWTDCRDAIRKVRIDEGITEIGCRAFEGCANLEEVRLPSSLRRIRAYAFRNCAALKTIEAGDRKFRYIYEKPRREDWGHTGADDKTVIFGAESFDGTPWAREYFGPFYCRDGVLYIYFPENAFPEKDAPEGCSRKEDVIRIPEGVHTIAKFAFRNLRAGKLELPETFSHAEENAFLNTKFDRILMPYEMDFMTAEEAANLLCALGDGAERLLKANARSVKVPYLYELALVNSDYGEFKRLVVRRKKEKAGGGGTWGRELVDVGDSVCRRLRGGGILIGIRYDEERRIQDVRSFVWKKEYGMFEECVLYPCPGKYGGIEPYDAPLVYQEPEEILNGFEFCRGEALIENHAIRYADEGISEEWFWAPRKGDFGGCAELELLEKWMDGHPDFSIDSMKENEEKQRYRIFIEV